MKKLIILSVLMLSLTSYLAGQNGTWTVGKTPMPEAKGAPVTEVVNRKIFVIGGFVMVDENRANSIADAGIEVYDPVTDSWDTTRTSMPTPRMFAASAVVDGKIYVCGGTALVGPSYLNTIEAYDPIIDSWESKNPMPTPRWGCRTAVIGGKIHVLGSSDTDQRMMESHEVYDPETDQWEILQPIPEPVWDMYVDTLNGEIYLFGGLKILPAMEKAIQIYNPGSDSWRNADIELPYNIGGAAGSARLNNKIYLIAPTIAQNPGYIFSGIDDVLMYDSDNKLILKVGEIPTSRAYAPAHCIGDQIFVIGGMKGDMDITHYSDGLCTEVEVYTPVANPIYAKTMSLSDKYISPENGSVNLQTEFINDDNAGIIAYAHLKSTDGLVKDSVLLYDDGLHNDDNAQDGIYGTSLSIDSEAEFLVGVSSINTDNGEYFIREDIARITSIGPLVFDGFNFPTEDTIPNPGDVLPFYMILSNLGQTATATELTAFIKSNNDLAAVSDRILKFDDISAGQNIASSTRKTISISEDCPDSTLLSFPIDIYSRSELFWRDTFQIKVGYGIVSGRNDYILSDPYEMNLFPNPATDVINISGLTQPANIKIYNLQGKVLKSYYQVINRIDISDLNTGIYILNFEVGDQMLVRKIVKE